jgi:DNA-binding MarR family transcriptional regulator
LAKTDGNSLGVLSDLAGYHLRRASAVFAMDFNRVLEDAGMRQVPFAVLSVIAANPGMNQGGVGRLLGIQRANMVALINDLEARGLIERTADASDRRAFVLALTPRGEAMLKDCHARIKRHEKRLLADLSKEERTTLLKLLARIEAREEQGRTAG